MGEASPFPNLDSQDHINVMVVDNSNRGEALGWKLRQAERIGEIITLPYLDNGSLVTLPRIATETETDLVVIGQDKALGDGLVDALALRGIAAFGPNKRNARIEANKEEAKILAHRAGIPTADYVGFSDARSAHKFAEERLVFPIVAKDIHLAGGHGVVVADDEREAHQAIDDLFGRRLSNQGLRIIIEDFAPGLEVSHHAFVSGKTYKSLPTFEDYKQLLRGDKGPMTGSMGGISPAPGRTMADALQANKQFVEPLLEVLDEDYVGIVYSGLKGLLLLEWNARFGDTEAQSYMRRLDSDLLEIIVAAVNRRLDKQPINWSDQHTICVVGAGEGYPTSKPQAGKLVEGLELEPEDDSVVIFSAGIDEVDGKLYTNGAGRLLNVTVNDETASRAHDKAYAIMGEITVDGKPIVYRDDIGQRRAA